MAIPNDTANAVPEPRIAICTALPNELAACRAMLDSPRPINPTSADDPNQYWLGTLPSRGYGQPHQVLLTSLAKKGNNVAATAVTNLVRSFPSVEFIAMVGIAGGVPDPQNVVTNEQGVLQYDDVKLTPDHKVHLAAIGSANTLLKDARRRDWLRIEIRDNSPRPGLALIAAAKALEAERMSGRSERVNDFETPRFRI